MRPLGVQIAAMLAARGVKKVFGIPGVHNIELYRGIEDAGITHVLARNETGAGFMADGYARATGTPGVAFVITGPGLLNAMTPIGQAFSDSVPMLVIATCLDETAARRGQLHQMLDQAGAGRGAADWSEVATSPEAAYELIDRAFAEFRLERPRPKILHVPVSVLGADAPAPPPPVDLAPPVRAAAEDSVVALAARLVQSRKPLFVFGGGARAIPAQDVVQLLERSGAASFVTYAGRGVVPPTTRFFLGSSLARPSSADVVAQSDCVVAIGTELAEVDLWRDHLGAVDAVTRIDLDPAILAESDQIPIFADAGQAVAQLVKTLPDGAGASDWSAQEIQRQRQHWRDEVAAERPSILPVCEALQQALPTDVLVYSDMTQFAYAAKEVWDMPAPGQWHHPFGFGTLGFAVPAALGAVAAGRPAVAIVGDSGLQYTLPELGTAAELGRALPILLWDNAALGEIRDAMIRAQMAPNAVTQQNPDWQALAQAYRLGFEAPSNLTSLADALRTALAADRPTLIRMTPALAG